MTEFQRIALTLLRRVRADGSNDLRRPDARVARDLLEQAGYSDDRAVAACLRYVPGRPWWWREHARQGGS